MLWFFFVLLCVWGYSIFVETVLQMAWRGRYLQVTSMSNGSGWTEKA